MRSTFTILLCTLVAVAIAQTTERKTPSQIKEVTVFLNGAQVTRLASIDLPSGVSTWVLSNLSSSINEQSLQVDAPGVKVLSVSFRTNHLEPAKKSEALSALEREKTRLESLIADEKANLEVFREEESMLKSNKEIGGQQGMNVEDLKTAVDYFRSRMLDLKQKQQQIQSRIATYHSESVKIEAQLVELRNQKTKPTGEVVMKASVKTDTRATFRVSYLVQEAKWFPSYDVRARDIKSPIAITYKANVSQQSGEDWENVELTISSANPSSTGARPILNAWYLGFNNSYAGTASGSVESLSGSMAGVQITKGDIRGRVVSAEDGSPLPGVNVVIKGTSMGTVTDVNGEYSLATSNADALVFSFIGLQTQEVKVGSRSYIDVALNQDVTQLSEVVVTGMGIEGSSYGSGYYREPRVKKTIVATPVVRQTNIEYKIDEPYTIKSDGEMRTVEMIEYDVDALYQYYCAPKLDTDAFLLARLINWDEYNFLEGEASLFFEGKFLGKSVLDTRSAEDTLTISLGRDKNVMITRDKVKDFSSNQVLSGNRKATFAYEIKIRNKKQHELEIRIEDQIPVPNTKAIMVDKLEVSNAEYNEETGLLIWNKKITPGKTEKIDLKYSVRYPRWSHIILE